MSEAPRIQPQTVDFFLDLFDDSCNQRVSKQVSKGTLVLYGYPAGKFCEWAESQGLTPNSVTRQQVRAYIVELTMSGLAKATVNLHGRNIKALIRFGVLEGICPEIDFTDLLPKPPRRKQPVARKQYIEKFLDQDPSLCDRAIVLNMFESGIRRAEASKLDWGDLDFSPSEMVRVKVRSGKGDKDRMTFVGPRARKSLTAYRKTVDDGKHDPVFVSRFGARLGIQGIDGVFKRLSRKADLALTPHTLRGGFAGEHRRMGVWDLQRLMEHASVKTTRLYVQTGVDDLLESYPIAH